MRPALATQFATCSIALALVKPVYKQFGAATASGNNGDKRGNTSPMRCRDLQPPLPDDRTYSRWREAPAGIGVIIHFGDVDLGAAAGVVQGSAHDQRPPGVALD